MATQPEISRHEASRPAGEYGQFLTIRESVDLSRSVSVNADNCDEVFA